MIQNRESLKEAFESKKFPNGQDYSNLIDSYVHKTDRYSTQADLIEYEGVEGEIAQHIGKSTETLVNGYFYKKSNGQWQRINVQNGGGGSVINLDDKPEKDSENAVKSSGIYNALQKKQESIAGQATKSFVLGIGLVATSPYQTIIGRYNEPDTEGRYMFICGNGTSDSNRSNAWAVTWDGVPEGNSYESVVINKGGIGAMQEVHSIADATESGVLYVVTPNN